MTTTARELFEEWYSMCSFNSGDTKYACSEAWRQAYERGRESVLSCVPERKEEFKQGKYVQGERYWNECVDEFHKRIAKLKEPANVR